MATLIHSTINSFVSDFVDQFDDDFEDFQRVNDRFSEHQIPLDFHDRGLMYLLRYPTGSRIVDHNELDCVCQKCFGDLFQSVEDAMLHGEVIEGFSVEVLG